MPTEQSSQTVIRLSVYTDRLPLAQHTGRMFDRISRAFDDLDEIKHLPRWERPRLRLVTLEIGSMIADFLVLGEALGNVVAMADFGGLARTFTRRLRKAALIMAGKDEGTVTKAERTAINALSLPIARDKAKQVNVQVVGDNNVVNFVELTPELWKQMEKNRPRRSKRGKIEEAVGTAAAGSSITADGKTVHHLIARDVATSPPSIGNHTLTVHDAVSKTELTSPSLSSPERYSDMENPPVIRGEAQWFRDAWHVVPHDTRELVPVRNEKVLQGRGKSKVYPVEGRLVSHSGRPVGFRITVIGEPNSMTS